MKLKPHNNLNQHQLRNKIEHNMELITEIFKTYREDDHNNLTHSLTEEVFRKTSSYPYNNIEQSVGYMTENRLRNSLEFTIKKHKGQYRDSGVHYASHPIQNGYLVAEFGFGEELIITANLHDILEENENTVLRTMNEIEIRFGQGVLDNILALSIFEKGEERDEKQINKLWFASLTRNNYDILYLKLADVISNLYTKKQMHGKNGMTAKQRQKKYSMNAKKHILPIAHLIDNRGDLDLHMTSYIQELIYR